MCTTRWYYAPDAVLIGCIDKSSSAELSEAINSMFRWYQGAGICFAFLSDVHIRGHILEGESLSQALAKSKWFMRGWTLQELLAPHDVYFYGAEWLEPLELNRNNAHLGSKIALRSLISQITGIDEATLEGKRSVESASVAQRMSWAANRQTSRFEDEASSCSRNCDSKLRVAFECDVICANNWLA